MKQKQSKTKNCYREHCRRTYVGIHCYRRHSLKYPIKVKQNLRPISENRVLFFKKSRDSTTLPWLERISACTEAQHLAEFSRGWNPERENHQTAQQSFKSAHAWLGFQWWGSSSQKRWGHSASETESPKLSGIDKYPEGPPYPCFDL